MVWTCYRRQSHYLHTFTTQHEIAWSPIHNLTKHNQQGTKSSKCSSILSQCYFIWCPYRILKNQLRLICFRTAYALQQSPQEWTHQQLVLIPLIHCKSMTWSKITHKITAFHSFEKQKPLIQEPGRKGKRTVSSLRKQDGGWKGCDCSSFYTQAWQFEVAT